MVADRLTRPLLGHAFRSFLEDLGMHRREENAEEETTGASRASIAMALLTAGTMLPGVDAGEEEEESGSEFEAIWACGAILTTLGAIYLGQLTFASVRCCLRRWCVDGCASDEVSCWNPAFARCVAPGSNESVGTKDELFVPVFTETLNSGLQQRSMALVSLRTLW